MEKKTAYVLSRTAFGKKRRGLYVMGYAKGDFFTHGDLYDKLVKFIHSRSLEISGNAYEDYILDAILITNPDDNLLRLSNEVREKKAMLIQALNDMEKEVVE